MPTATSGKMNLEAVAKGCGIDNACTIEDAAAFREKIQNALANPGPHFIRARVEALDQDGPPKTKRVPDPRENKYQFAGYIQRTEGVEILGSGLGGGGYEPQPPAHRKRRHARGIGHPGLFFVCDQNLKTGFPFSRE